MLPISYISPHPSAHSSLVSILCLYRIPLPTYCTQSLSPLVSVVLHICAPGTLPSPRSRPVSIPVFSPFLTFTETVKSLCMRFCPLPFDPVEVYFLIHDRGYKVLN